MTIVNSTFQFYLIMYLLVILYNFVNGNIFYLMLPSIGIVFPCIYMQYCNGLIINNIVVASQWNCNSDWIKATVTVLMTQTLTAQFHGDVVKLYAGRLKTVEDGAIDVNSENNYAPNPIDKLATKTFYLIEECYLYWVSLTVPDDVYLHFLLIHSCMYSREFWCGLCNAVISRGNVAR